MDRSIVFDKKTHKVSAGIPQSSVPGPILWNIFYNPVLKIRHEHAVETIGLVDDLSWARNNEELI